MTQEAEIHPLHRATLAVPAGRPARLIVVGLVCVLGFLLVSAVACSRPATPKRPNVLFILADDMSWPHAGIYGDGVVATPAFDELAREGVLFNYAYSATSSCSASRNAILTGQQPWRLGEGAQFSATLSVEHVVFPLMLQEAGYEIAWVGKSWGPGDLKAGGWGDRHPVGPMVGSARGLPVEFEKFLEARTEDVPFFFWFGSRHPHRPYVPMSGVRSGKRVEDVKLPGFLPDLPVVRHDVLDYYVAVESFDRQVGHLVDTLRRHRLLESTIVIVTSDHGMPFPRVKSDCYDMSNHVPLTIRWSPAVPGGRRIDDFVSLTDLAPTILEAAGVQPPPEMTGRSILQTLRSGKSGLVEGSRDFVVTSFERHAWCRPEGVGYPVRAIRTHGYMYLFNLEPDRWPNGDPQGPETSGTANPGRGAAFLDVAPSPTKETFIAYLGDPAISKFFELAFGKRPEEELYDMVADPWQVGNVVGDPRYADVKADLRDRLRRYLLKTDDPRARGENPFDSIPMRALGSGRTSSKDR